MTVSLYDVSVVPVIRHLKTIKTLIAKGQAECNGDESKITSARLIEDMGDFCFQIQRVSDSAKFLAVRLGKVAPVSMPDTEKTIPECIARIDATLKILESVSPTSFDNIEDERIKFGSGPMELNMSAKDYVLKFFLSNFYFHFTMVYAILRKEGISLGKQDYWGDSSDWGWVNK